MSSYAGPCGPRSHRAWVCHFLFPFTLCSLSPPFPLVFSSLFAHPAAFSITQRSWTKLECLSGSGSGDLLSRFLWHGELHLQNRTDTQWLPRSWKTYGLGFHSAYFRGVLKPCEGAALLPSSCPAPSSLQGHSWNVCPSIYLHPLPLPVFSAVRSRSQNPLPRFSADLYLMEADLVSSEEPVFSQRSVLTVSFLLWFLLLVVRWCCRYLESSFQQQKNVTREVTLPTNASVKSIC